MAQKRLPAREAARPRSDSGFWIDHAEIKMSDLEWLRDAQRLILWNVLVPPGFMRQLPRLWWLDLRGGSGANLEVCQGAVQLEYLAVNQVRGMSDLRVIGELTSLRYLSLYGLPKVEVLPSCRSLHRLERVSVGQMRGLCSLSGVLEAPNLKELEFVRKVNVQRITPGEIRQHSSLERFGWHAEDVPDSTWEPFIQQVGLPPPKHEWPEDWFQARGRGSGYR